MYRTLPEGVRYIAFEMEIFRTEACLYLNIISNFAALHSAVQQT